MRTSRATWSWFLAVGALFSLLTGCPGTLDDKARFLVDAAALDAADADAGAHADADADADACGDVPTRILVPSCGSNGCHSASAPQQGLDLVSPGVAARVVGVQAKVCPGTLADPDNPRGSLLYSKLAPRPPCGAQMPIAQPPLSSADAACVLAWIAGQ